MITVVGSLKGGSGKSTVTFNLAVWLAMADVKVQLVDADPQATNGVFSLHEGAGEIATVGSVHAAPDSELTHTMPPPPPRSGRRCWTFTGGSRPIRRFPKCCAPSRPGPGSWPWSPWAP